MEDIDHLLDARDVQALVGQLEGAQLEAKSTPYDLTSAKSRFELAKDVSAFANHEGGHIIIGAVTEREPDAQVDKIVGIDPIDPTAVRPDVYLGVLQQYVYPRLNGQTVAVVHGLDSGHVVGVIRVPRQDQDRGPFSVLRVIEGDEELSPALVGYFRRMDDANEPMDARRLQRGFRHGMSTTAARLASIEAKVDGIAERLTLDGQGVELVEELQDARIERMLEEEG